MVSESNAENRKGTEHEEQEGKGEEAGRIARVSRRPEMKSVIGASITGDHNKAAISEARPSFTRSLIAIRNIRNRLSSLCPASPPPSAYPSS